MRRHAGSSRGRREAVEPGRPGVRPRRPAADDGVPRPPAAPCAPRRRARPRGAEQARGRRRGTPREPFADACDQPARSAPATTPARRRAAAPATGAHGRHRRVMPARRRAGPGRASAGRARVAAALERAGRGLDVRRLDSLGATRLARSPASRRRPASARCCRRRRVARARRSPGATAVFWAGRLPLRSLMVPTSSSVTLVAGCAAPPAAADLTPDAPLDDREDGPRRSTPVGEQPAAARALPRSR